jgi:hypothetical protein
VPVVTGDYYVDIYSDTYTGTDEVIETWTGSGTYSWTCPAGVFTILCECWAGGGGGGFGQDVNIISPPITYLVLGGGGGGGEYAAEPALSVTPGVTYTFSIGPAGAGAAAVAASGGSANPGGPTIFTGDSVTVTASGGGGGTSGTISAAGGAGGTGSTNTTHHDGGAGGAGNFSAVNGGGGGGSGGTGSAGSAGSGSGSGAAAVSGGGPGGAGGTSTGSPSGHAPGSGPGGGGGGAQYGATSNRGYPGGRGWAGQVRITWTYTGIADLAGGTGQVYASTSSPLGYVVNQWAGTIEQNQTFGYSAPGIQSCVVPLTPAASLGEGTGYPAAGNWLFAVAGWQATTGAAISIGDDSHQWWRPARTSLKTAASVTSIWYQPNIIPPAAVYAAPDAYIQGLALTVVEVAGLSPWDVVAGAASQHSNSSASLTMTLGAPSGAAFIIAAATGGNSGTFTSLAPEGWIPLQSVTAGNGTDTSGDAILQTVVQDTAGATSVTVTAGMAEPLSCAMVSVLASAPSPVPAGINPAWPYLIFEAAFGSGYGTHLDSMTWTNLQTQANGRRLRKWEESTGTQYELDQLEASELTLTLDNPDGALSPWNSASPWAGTVVPATPVRIRAVPPASAGVNRWYVISRNIERWPQSWDEAYRGLAAATATDVWSVINKTLATTYRAEVQLDSPYAWWPCDDSGLNDPRALVNAAAGNNKPLSITVMPGGLSAIITQYPFGYPVAYSATQAYAQLTGWMYGDPLSAAWQQAGVGLSSTGRYLTCKDSGFPAISSGITIEGWWNFGFIDPDGQAATGSGPYGQPSDADLALWNIYKSGVADNIGVAITLDVATGNVILEVTPAAGGFPDPITVAGTVDKRDASWMHVICTLSSSGYYAAVNGGFVGSASGTWGAGQAPASSWDTFAALALPGIGVGCGNAAVSHLAVYPAVLPPARIQAHVNAAYAAFGQIPPPVAAATFTANNSGSAYDPSGVQRTGQAFGPPGDGNPTLAAVACSIAGTFTSAPSSPETIQLVAPAGTDLGFMWLDAGAGTATSGDFAAARYQWFTASQGGSEQLAATTSHPYLYVNGFGSGITPPATASPLGDSVAWRIERLLQQGRACTPRCIDPASAACLAQLDTGGQVTGDAVNNIVQSDDGLLFVDNQGFVCYWSRPHLAAQTPVWQVGPGNPAALNLTTSFEGGAYPWTPVNGATLTTSAIWAESGTASALFSGNGATAGPGIQSENIYGIMAGTTYTASAWMYSTANYAAGVTVTAAWYNSSASLISQVSATPVPLTAGTAVQVTVTGAAPAGTAYAVITAATAGTPGAITHFFADAAMLIAGSLAIPAVPYSNDATWDTDPQHCYNDVEITQYDVTQAAATAQSGLSTGSGVQAGGLVFAPAASLYPQIVASQAQYGDCQYQLTSYLQSTAEIQAQANWLFENFGTPVQRITGLVVDAAAKAHTSPYSWVFILGVNVGDVITATMRQPGQPPFSGTWRITHIDRTISFGEDGQAQASAAIIADYWPPAEWT